METNQIIKPGTAAYANSLVQSGKTVQQALTPNMFTGKDGITNLNSYINNPVAQVAGAVVGLKIAQKALTTTGLITGKESGTAIAGLVMAASTVGIQNTVDFVKNAATQAFGAVTGVVGTATKAVNSLLGSPGNLIAGGNFAGGLAEKVTGALGGISTSLEGLKKTALGSITGLIDSAKGVSAAAFGAITASIPTLKAGVPQNIKDITEKAIAAAQAPVAVPNVRSLRGITSVTDAATGALNSVTGAVSTVTGALGTVDATLSTATGVIKTATGITANLSTGLDLLPGGGGGSSLVNNAIGAVKGIPGVAAVTGLIGQASSITAGISNLASVNPLASSGVLNAVTGVTGALTKGLDDLKSGKLSLASLASAGLPAGAAAQLNAAISSMSSGGAVQIKLPTVAINTTDRSELTSQVTSLLGNAKIPAPNFTGEISATAKTALEKITEAKKAKTAKIAELDEKLAQQKKLADDAIAEQQTAKNSLPAGDPSIEELRQKAMVEVDKQIAIQNEIVATLRA